MSHPMEHSGTFPKDIPLQLRAPQFAFGRWDTTKEIPAAPTGKPQERRNA
jgi:hypothetical protein